MARKGQENLIPLNKRSKEVQREIQEMGRRANKAKIRHEKDLKIALKVALGILKTTPKGIELSIAEGMAQKLAQEALNGDWKAMQIIIDLLYGKEQKIALTSPDGSMSPKSATFDLSGFTPEQIADLSQAAFRGE